VEGTSPGQRRGLAAGLAVFGEVGGGRSGGLAVENGDPVEAFDLISFFRQLRGGVR
jgi:hypothetical protein